MSEIKAIETEYKGYRFRSRAEARWAILFENSGIEYQYEPEGFEFSDGTKYLPDFYLPESDTFFEVKGVMQDIDEHKIDMMLKESKKQITIGYADMTFEASSAWSDGEYSISGKGESMLARCNKCGKLYFMGEEGSWYCRCCGAYDGDGHFEIVMHGDGSYNDDFEPFVKARGARFEHGEKPIIVNSHEKIEHEEQMKRAFENALLSLLPYNEMWIEEINENEFSNDELREAYKKIKERKSVREIIKTSKNPKYMEQVFDTYHEAIESGSPISDILRVFRIINVQKSIDVIKKQMRTAKKEELSALLGELVYSTKKLVRLKRGEIR